ncbi:hypothetical protein C8F01DRAFT_1250813 [Mycena amicta]|nr:hypothetical protein C8F01DRAFT_1250813 [Mycena amicta]
MQGIGENSTIPSQGAAHAHRVYQITLGMLAYALCQISIKSPWTATGSGYDYKKLFTKVAVFKLQSETAVAWAKETLDELTKAVFANNELASMDDGDEEADAADDLFCAFAE